MWYGKIIAGLIGFTVAGVFGLIIGVVLGHSFDKALAGLKPGLSAEERAQVEEIFFKTVFLLMGRLAKIDGRISEAEIAHTQQLMEQMALHSEHRQRAIQIFQEGARGDFDLNAELQNFRTLCARHPALTQQLLNYLLSLSLADGVLSKSEEDFLREVSIGLGISAAVFNQLLKMIRAQTHFRHDGGYQHRHGGSGQYAPTKDELALAYEALGASPQMSDGEIKKKYRKLMSENHPDKLTGQGVPEDMIKLATERAQEIQTAYELIKKYRS